MVTVLFCNVPWKAQLEFFLKWKSSALFSLPGMVTVCWKLEDTVLSQTFDKVPQNPSEGSCCVDRCDNCLANGSDQEYVKSLLSFTGANQQHEQWNKHGFDIFINIYKSDILIWHSHQQAFFVSLLPELVI